MNTILSYWRIDWFSTGLLLLLLSYLCFAPLTDRRRRLGYYMIVLLVFVICFDSPLHLIAMDYLFSAHMILHVLLLLIAAPFLVLCLFSRESNNRLMRFFLFIKEHPFWGWICGVGIMWFWHIPVVFKYSMTGMTSMMHGFHPLAYIETISLLVTGMVFSAPVVHPNRNVRLENLSGVVYLFTACIGCTLLGILITFAPTGLYHHYLSHTDMPGFNSVIANQWNISEAVDQQAAGLIMWVPCCLIYVTGAMYLLMEWFHTKEPETFAGTLNK